MGAFGRTLDCARVSPLVGALDKRGGTQGLGMYPSPGQLFHGSRVAEHRVPNRTVCMRLTA